MNVASVGRVAWVRLVVRSPHIRWGGTIAMVLLAFAVSAAGSQPSKARFTLIGLDPAAVEKKIGAPDEKDDLADSDETFWIYRTAYGTLSVHFQNHVVVSFTPEDFPLDQIIKDS